MTLQEQYEREEKKLQRFDTVEDAIEYAREHMDCSTADKACFIMKTPDKKQLVVSPLPLCSFLDQKGYKGLIGTFDLSDVIQGKTKFSDVIEES